MVGALASALAMTVAIWVIIGCSGCSNPPPFASYIESEKVLEAYIADSHSTTVSSDAGREEESGDIFKTGFRTYDGEWAIQIPSGKEQGFLRGFRERIPAAATKHNGRVDGEGKGIASKTAELTHFSYTIRFSQSHTFLAVRSCWIPSGNWIPSGTGKKALFLTLTQVDFR